MSSPARHEADFLALLQATIAALQESSELIERYVWSAAPEEAAEAQANNHRAIRALKAARSNVPALSKIEHESTLELLARS